jgi:chloride channel 7
MGENVVFVKPVEKVGVIYDILKSCRHSNFPVVDQDDGGILFGSISKNTLGVLLKERAFGHPTNPITSSSVSSSNFFEVQEGAKKQQYMPIVQWEQLEKSYPKYPTYNELRMSQSDRDCYVDLRPYSNTSPVTVQEFASIDVSPDDACFVCSLIISIGTTLSSPNELSFAEIL